MDPYISKQENKQNFECCGEPLTDLRALVDHFAARHCNVVRVDPGQPQAPATLDFLKFATEKDFLDADRDVLQKVLDIAQLIINRDEADDIYDSRYLDRFLKHAAERRGILPSAIFLSGVVLDGQFKVGAGGFGDIYRGKYKEKAVALKALRLFRAPEREKMGIEISKEAHLWRKLDHPNILPFLGICRNVVGEQIALVSPWMEKGSLSDFLKGTPQADYLKFPIGVARGLAYLHGLKPPIIHGDLRAANVLVDENDEPRITDFGLSRAIDSQGTSISASFTAGTLRWQAPELIFVTQYEEGTGRLTTKSDVYSFSCLCIEVFTGKAPFHGLRNGMVILAVAEGKRPPPPGHDAILKGLDDDVWSIMQLCWKPEPSERPDIRDVVSRLEHIHSRRNSS